MPSKCHKCGAEPPVPVITWFASNLRAYRKKHGLTQTQLADAMRIEKSSLCRWERSQWPRLGNFVQACRRAGIDPVELIGSYLKEAPDAQ